MFTYMKPIGSTLKEMTGVLLKDFPRYRYALWGDNRYRDCQGNPPWVHLRNRNESLIDNPSGPGVICDWQWSSKLHACQIFPGWGRQLLKRAFADLPIEFAKPIVFSDTPAISFIIAHGGRDRLPQLNQVIRSLASQKDVPIECLVVDQTPDPIGAELPDAVRYFHLDKSEVTPGWYKSWAYNIGARMARGDVVVFHDGDICVPKRYPTELTRWLIDGDYETASIQRFLFYLDRNSTDRFCETESSSHANPETILQNWLGGTIAIRTKSFFDIGGFDEGFVDWGGEDTEFFDRCRSLKQMAFGYLPFLHLWHPAQVGRRVTTNINIAQVLPWRLNLPREQRRRELSTRTIGEPHTPNPILAYKDWNLDEMTSPRHESVGRISIKSDLVSAIIPVYNRPQMLREAVASVLAQTYRPIEIIIADDGSTDQTFDVAEEFQRKHPEIIKTVRHENQGPGLARELGRKLAEGDFLQYLDSDDRLLPNKFADQVAALRQHSDCDIAYGITRLVDDAGRILKEPFKWTDRRFQHLYPGLLVDRWWCTHTPLYRRKLTDRIGPWRDMRWSQDWEYDARAGALQVKLVNCGTCVSEHRHHDGVRQTSFANWERDPIRLRNRVELLTRLWTNAELADINRNLPECQHFIRWCFAIARNCAFAGLSQESKQCLRLIERISINQKLALDIRLFNKSSQIIGPLASAHLLQTFRSFKKTPGQQTMLQSFTKSSS